MIIDNTDIKIIQAFYNIEENEITNTYGIAKKVFPKLDYCELPKVITTIKRKLKKLEEYSLMKIIDDKPKIFELQYQNVFFKRIKIETTFHNFICLKIKEYWCFFELSQ